MRRRRRERLAASKNPRKSKYMSRNTIQGSPITATLSKESNGWTKPNLLDLKKASQPFTPCEKAAPLMKETNTEQVKLSKMTERGTVVKSQRVQVRGFYSWKKICRLQSVCVGSLQATWNTNRKTWKSLSHWERVQENIEPLQEWKYVRI